MDIFMDKLAQRLTAQDIIQANTAADMEEMNKLKAQIAEYYQCLEQLRRMLDDETARLRNSQVSGENVNRLVDESIAKIRAVQLDPRGTEELQKQLSRQLDSLERQVGNKLDAMTRQINGKLEILERAGGRIDALEQVGGKLDAIGQQVGGRFGVVEQQVGGRLDSIEQQLESRLDALEQQLGDRFGTLEQQMSDQLGSMNQQVGDRLNGLDRQVGETLGKLERQADTPQDTDDDKLTEKFTTLEENVHKECVKVYRNVQAVVVEENSKQSDAMTETLSAVGKMKGKTGAILSISIVALLASLGGILLQLMQIMGIF